MIEKIRKSLVLKTTLIFLVAAILPSLLATLLILNSAEQILYKSIFKDIEADANLARNDLDAKLFQMKNNAEAWANLEVIEDLLINARDERVSGTLEELKKDYGLSGNIYVLDPNGTVEAASMPEVVGRVWNNVDIKNILSGGTVALGRHRSEISGMDAISFCAPIRSHTGRTRVVGILIVEYDMKDLKTAVASSAPAYLAVIDRNGEVIVSTDERPFNKDLGFLLDPQPREPVFREKYLYAAAKSKGYGDFKGFGWTVALAIKERIARKPIVRLEQAVVWVILISLAILFALIMAVAKRTIKPIKKISSTSEQIAGTKDFSRRIDVASVDEIGRLAASFNYMVEEVSNYIKRIKEMEERIRRDDRLAALGELSAGMAHEIKNPLGIIKSSSEILRERMTVASQNHALASAISEEATRLAKILDTFLRFARPGIPQPSFCLVNEIINKVFELLGPDISRGGVSVEKKLDEALPIIETDPDQLYQVFMNIIINAVQAMPSGGMMEVRTGIARPYGEGKEEMVEITFTDTGPGIPAEYRERVFNPFFTTKEKGSGLGLAIVHSIIEALGGWVKLEDVPGKGARFAIYLPLKDRAKVDKETA